MEALTELCDLIAQNPTQFADKLSWICTRCPSPSTPRLTRSHLNSLLTLARFLSKSPDTSPPSRSPLFDFLRSAPFRPSIWPQSFPIDSVNVFFSSMLNYIALACSISLDLRSEVRSFFGQTVIAAVDDGEQIAKVFLNAVSQNYLPMVAEDAERAVGRLLVGIGDGGESLAVSESTADSKGKGKGKEEGVGIGGESSAVSESTPDSKGKGKEEEAADNGCSCEARENGDGTVRMENGSSCSSSVTGMSGGGGGGGRFEEEAVEGLERMEIAFRLVTQVMDGGGGGNVRIGNLEEVRKMATNQLKSLPAFLKVKALLLFLN